MSKISLNGNPALLLCEGIDEAKFLIYYIQYLIKCDSSFNKIEVLDFGGVRDLTKYLQILSQQDGFEKVRTIAIIRDAENDWEAALQSVENSINHSGIDRKLFSDRPYYLLPMPKKDGVWQNGTLENLCLDILNMNVNDNFVNYSTLNYSREYIYNIEKKNNYNLSRQHKNLLHAYFSATNRFVNMKIGEAARAQAFDWDSKNLSNLREFLNVLVDCCRE